jgi:hypothetical protein
MNGKSVKKMFNKIWKAQIQKPKGQVGFWKPKTEIRRVQDKDENKNCCEEFVKSVRTWLNENVYWDKLELWKDYSKNVGVRGDLFDLNIQIPCSDPNFTYDEEIGAIYEWVDWNIKLYEYSAHVSKDSPLYLKQGLGELLKIEDDYIKCIGE